MRILYLHQYFVPREAHGGTRSYEFASRLIASGHEVYMITSSAMLPAQYQNITQKTRLEISGVPTVVLPIPYSNFMSFRRRIRVFLQFAIQASIEAMQYEADVVFATSPPLTIAIPGMLAHFWQRIPFVFEVADLWPELPIAMGALRNPLAIAAARALEWVTYHTAAHVVALSPGMAAGVIQRGIPPERVTVLPNGSDVDLFDVPESSGDRFRDRLGLASDQPLIIYTGTFGFVNGVDYLVDVAAAMQAIDPDIRFLLVGNGVKRNDVVARAKKVGVLDKNLWVWDPLPKNEMPDIMAAATVTTSTVIPLEPLFNNSANKFFDSLAASRPIAINYQGWQADLLHETGAGIVLPQGDPIQAACELAGFVRDKKRVNVARQAARELATTRFDRELLAQKLESIFQSVANK